MGIVVMIVDTYTCYTLQGEFAENEYHGMGVYSWPDGSSYTGQFEHNR